jgi:N6-adenosine-specific RNA methylase IME4
MESGINTDDIIIVNDENREHFKETVLNFLKKYFNFEEIDVSDLELAYKLKKYCDEYNCVIVSWIRNGEAYAECYEANTYDCENDLTWGFVGAQNEVDVILGAFVWLLDHNYLTKENISC